jgi:transcriptional regulator with XRE-family HTH domain
MGSNFMITPRHLRMARAGLKLTLAELSAQAGVNPNTISRYESGRSILSGTLMRIENALRASGAIFLDDEEGQGVRLPCANNRKLD